MSIKVLPLTWDRPLAENRRLLQVISYDKEDEKEVNIKDSPLDCYLDETCNGFYCKLQNGEKVAILREENKIAIIAIYKKSWRH